jgi:hypothetical protein
MSTAHIESLSTNLFTNFRCVNQNHLKITALALLAIGGLTLTLLSTFGVIPSGQAGTISMGAVTGAVGLFTIVFGIKQFKKEKRSERAPAELGPAMNPEAPTASHPFSHRGEPEEAPVTKRMRLSATPEHDLSSNEEAPSSLNRASASSTSSINESVHSGQEVAEESDEEALNLLHTLFDVEEPSPTSEAVIAQPSKKEADLPLPPLSQARVFMVIPEAQPVRPSGAIDSVNAPTKAAADPQIDELSEVD